MKTYKGQITSLKNNEVFVFGANTFGWHGAGAAGYASFNELGNVWRKHSYDKWPNGTKGKWNVKGVAEGLMEGTNGKSYAIPTVTKCGAKRSIPLDIIEESIFNFFDFTLDNPQYVFYIAQAATPGLNGYSPEEMAGCYRVFDWPDNVYFEEEFSKLL